MSVDAAASPALVPSGAAYFPVTGEVVTRRYAFLLLPDFTLLAFSSALDPLRIANQLSHRPLYHWRVISLEGTPVASSSGVSVCTEAVAPLDPDVTLLICSGNLGIHRAVPRPLLSALTRHHRFGGNVGGICTGAVALAQAGLLEARSFTLHWENQPSFVENFPDLTPSANRFEIDGRVLTCGGGAAATDMMLHLIAAEHGASFAALVAEMCLRPMPIGGETGQRSSLAAVLQSRNPVLIGVVARMRAHLEEPLSIDTLADEAGISRRQLERVFRATLGESPQRVYQHLRLDRARGLLVETDLPLAEIGAASGFATQEGFVRAFRARFGVAPSRVGYRRRTRG